MGRTGKLDEITTADWAVETIPAWRHSVWVGVWDPWPVVKRPYLWWKVIRDAWCLEVMHRAFTDGLMECKRKPAAPSNPPRSRFLQGAHRPPREVALFG